jgi:hypothetical protein
VHTPAWQESVWVQALLSVQGSPSILAVSEHDPFAGLHVAMWHWSEAVHITGFAPTQAPIWQESVWVQALLSVQGSPFILTVFEHVPFAGLHVAMWHWSEAVHVTGFAPTQAPIWQESVCVHAFPSLQPKPFAAVGLVHAPVTVMQTPAVWHWSLAVQALAQQKPPAHALVLQSLLAKQA